MQISILGIDIGKNNCSVVGVDDRGAVAIRRTMRRQTLIEFVEKLPTCVIAMEACCGAHHLGRLFTARGHEVRLMSPEYVRPYVKAQKNDDRDAEGIAEAAGISPDDAVCRTEEPGTVGYPDIASGSLTAGCGTDDLDQPTPSGSPGERCHLRRRPR